MASVACLPAELASDITAASRPQVRHAELTGRGVEILALVGAGKTDAEIAEQLFISPKTASVHVSNLNGNLGAGPRDSGWPCLPTDGSAGGRLLSISGGAREGNEELPKEPPNGNAQQTLDSARIGRSKAVPAKGARFK